MRDQVHSTRTTLPIVRRCLAAAALAVAFGAPAAPVARAGNCNPLPEQTGFTATYTSNPGGDYVLLQWNADPDGTSITYRVFQAYRLERRDDTGGGAFAAFARVEGSNSVNTTVARDCVDGPQVATCPTTGQTSYAEPGHTYTYRVVTEYQFSPILCSAEADGLTHDSNSNEVQVAIPEPPSGAPKNVVAVADVKKPRVTVTWDKPDADPPTGAEYSVQRRVVTPAPAKDDSTFEEIAKFAAGDATVRRFLDKDVLPDTEYEYRVAVSVDQVLAASKPDDTFTSGVCAKSRFAVWDGDWTTTKDGDYGFLTSSKTYCDFCLGEAEGPAPCDDARALYKMSGPVRFGSAPKIKLQFANPALDEEGAIVKGSFTWEMERSDAFSPGSWRTATATLTGAHGLSRTFQSFRLAGRPPTTTVCGTFGSGAAKLKDGVAHAGDRVLFAFDAVALGPAPLFAGALQLQVDVGGGTIETVVGQSLLRLVGDADGKTQAVFDVGALGPRGVGRSDVASFLIAAKVADDLLAGKLRCTVAYKRVAGGDQNVITPILSRYLDVRVVPRFAALTSR